MDRQSGGGTPVIEARDLRFSYHSEPVLRGVTFAVAEGDFVSIIGANGAGKSTLLRLLLGELNPDGGEVCLLGEPVARVRDWRPVGYVPQNGAALADGFPATAAEVVRMGAYPGPLRFGRGARNRAEEALAAVGMADHAGRLVSKLSGGQVQRVLIARALAGESRLLLLDEPATGVDGDAAEALYRLLGGLAADRGLAVVMVTHDIARATPHTKRTLCLEHGSMVELTGEQIAHELEHRHHHP